MGQEVVNAWPMITLPIDMRGGLDDLFSRQTKHKLEECYCIILKHHFGREHAVVEVYLPCEDFCYRSLFVD